MTDRQDNEPGITELRIAWSDGRRELRIGHRLRAREAAIELTKVRTPCATLDVYGSGIQAAIYDARVQAGDTIALLD